MFFALYLVFGAALQIAVCNKTSLPGKNDGDIQSAIKDIYRKMTDMNLRMAQNIRLLQLELSELDKKVKWHHRQRTTMQPSTTPEQLSTTPDQCATTPVYYPPGTHEVHHVFKCYPQYNLTFVGYGARTSSGIMNYLEDVPSFDECITHCLYVRRTRGGAIWNGLEYHYDQEFCACFKISTGHQHFNHILHYAFL